MSPDGRDKERSIKGHKANFDIFWLKDESLEDLEAALLQFSQIAADLKK
jgi:hypothetical protein